MPTIVLSPLVDRDGLMIEGANGVPLAADDVGLVYTLRDDGEPEAMGALDQDDDGRVILVPLPPQAMAGLGALDPQAKGNRLIQLASRRAHARGRLAYWERTVARQRTNGMADHHPEQAKALARIERWKSKLAGIQAELERVNGEALAGDGDEMAGLGASWWTRNRNLIGGIAAGAAGTALVGSALTKGTGANSLMNTAWKGVKGFFTAPGADDATPAAPAPAPARAMVMPAAMPARSVAAAYAMPAPAAPQVMQAGMGGMDMKTLLLVGGLGLGAFVLLNRPKT